MKQTDIAWLAGLLEGEGSFTIESRSSNYSRVRVRLAMVDEDILIRVQKLYLELIGKQCNITTKHSKHENTQPICSIDIHGDHARMLMGLIVHLMGQRRRKKIWQILNGYSQPKVKLNILGMLKIKAEA